MLRSIGTVINDRPMHETDAIAAVKDLPQAL